MVKRLDLYRTDGETGSLIGVRQDFPGLTKHKNVEHLAISSCILSQLEQIIETPEYHEKDICFRPEHENNIPNSRIEIYLKGEKRKGGAFNLIYSSSKKEDDGICTLGDVIHKKEYEKKAQEIIKEITGEIKVLNKRKKGDSETICAQIRLYQDTDVVATREVKIIKTELIPEEILSIYCNVVYHEEQLKLMEEML